MGCAVCSCTDRGDASGGEQVKEDREGQADADAEGASCCQFPMEHICEEPCTSANRNRQQDNQYWADDYCGSAQHGTRDSPPPVQPGPGPGCTALSAMRSHTTGMRTAILGRCRSSSNATRRSRCRSGGLRSCCGCDTRPSSSPRRRCGSTYARTNLSARSHTNTCSASCCRSTPTVAANPAPPHLHSSWATNNTPAQWPVFGAP